jgi:hypothetical protein
MLSSLTCTVSIRFRIMRSDDGANEGFCARQHRVSLAVVERFTARRQTPLSSAHTHMPIPLVIKMTIPASLSWTALLR